MSLGISPTYVSLYVMNGAIFSQGKASFSEPTKELGRCIVPSKNEGNGICQSLLQMNGRFVPHCSLRCVILDKLDASNASEIRKRVQFDEAITAKLGN